MKLKPNPWLRKHLNIPNGEQMDVHSITMEQMATYCELYYAYLKQ